LVFDRRLGAEANIFDVNATEIQSHGPISTIYQLVRVEAGDAGDEGRLAVRA
jgi:hypothetical protein